ncbi:cytochrome c and c1 heme-lyase [Dipodascopsis tothii]|uniref:cytochrome c and c1 heme-lyase n=1 Tax=Dipodascopsis tothii TaxID=44089 RepID=UPI0034CDEE7B
MGLFSWWSGKQPTEGEAKCPVDHTKLKPAADASKCPVDHTKLKGGVNPLNNMPELSANRAPGQKGALDTERTFSSIPKGSDASEGVWEYPSPQQMFNAIVRKGKHADDDEEAVTSMVDVHNFLNEGAWEEILRWEAKYTADSGQAPRLLQFTGRPNDPSPRALMLQAMGKVFPSKFGIEPPFDRHDWTVQRALPGGDRAKVRYVIDYYSGPAEPDGSPSFYLDVRPALDSVTSAHDRFSVWSAAVWEDAMGKGGRVD